MDERGFAPAADFLMRTADDPKHVSAAHREGPHTKLIGARGNRTAARPYWSAQRGGM